MAEDIIDVKPGQMPFYTNDPSLVEPDDETKEGMIDLALIPQGSGSRLDADKVDGINAYVIPTPNCLVPLGPDTLFKLKLTSAGAYYAWLTFGGF